MRKNFNHDTLSGTREHKETQREKQKNFVSLRVFRGKKILHIISFLFLLSTLTACSSFPTNTPLPIETESPEVESISTPETQATEVPPIEENTPKVLRLWLPPQFDPTAETEAGILLRARLDSFTKRRPDLILEIRIKAEEGEASLLNALIATHEAAPSVMPDLIALSRPDLESAAQLGILHPIDGLTTLLDDPDWFPYARPLAHIQDSAYGLPFSANLLGLRYTPNEDFLIPTIENLLEQEKQILFPEDNIQLSFCLYGEGLPAIEEEALTNLLSFYQSDTFSLVENEHTLSIYWSNDFLDETPADALLMPILGPEGTTCSLASAWIWSLAGSAPDLQPAAVELAEYLSDSAFLAEWTIATGTLPPRPTALDETQTTLHELSLIAQPIPSNETVEALAEIFRAATISVLQEQVDPRAAAQKVLENIQ